MSYTQQDLDVAVKNAVSEERLRCITQVEREKQTWHFTSSSRAVRTACDNIISMIRGDK